jgi:hypothetical protein
MNSPFLLFMAKRIAIYIIYAPAVYDCLKLSRGQQPTVLLPQSCVGDSCYVYKLQVEENLNEFLIHVPDSGL